MPYDDTPKRWVEEDLDVEDGPNSAALMPMPAEEEIHLPTIEEQKEIIEEAKDRISPEHMEILKGMVEVNAMAELLNQTAARELQEHRRLLLDTICETFVNSHYQNNLLAEQLKRALILRLTNNIENMDLELTANTIIELMNALGTDVVHANSIVTNQPTSMPGQTPGINLTINTADGAGQVTNQTLNNGTLIQSANKETVSLGSTIKQMQSINMPRKAPIEVAYDDKMEK